MMLTNCLHPIKLKKGGEVYSVIFRGELLVERSTDPEYDAARALLAPLIDIERAAMLFVKEGPLRFAPYESRPDRSQTAETHAAEGEKGGKIEKR